MFLRGVRLLRERAGDPAGACTSSPTASRSWPSRPTGWTTDGLYLLDEPEAALSPQGQLALIVRIGDLVAAGSQFVLATHSPMLLAIPGATVYELDEDGALHVTP